MFYKICREWVDLLVNNYLRIRKGFDLLKVGNCTLKIYKTIDNNCKNSDLCSQTLLKWDLNHNEDLP